MPRLDQTMEEHKISGGTFTFTATRISDLGSTEYTLVTIAVDVTSSTLDFADELLKMLKAAVESCKKSPRSDNLLIRVVIFSSRYGITELHGFKQMAEIDPSTYQLPTPDGMTPLYDATYSSVGAMADFGKDLMAQDYLANGIGFIITDGGDNVSRTSPAMIRDQIESIRRDEKLESLVMVLIGINVQRYKRELEIFRQEAGLDQFIDAGDATPGKLAKLASFVSRSVSSQSQAIGTGGPSQNIQATI